MKFCENFRASRNKALVNAFPYKAIPHPPHPPPSYSPPGLRPATSAQVPRPPATWCSRTRPLPQKAEAWESLAKILFFYQRHKKSTAFCSHLAKSSSDSNRRMPRLPIAVRYSLRDTATPVEQFRFVAIPPPSCEHFRKNGEKAWPKQMEAVSLHTQTGKPLMPFIAEWSSW